MTAPAPGERAGTLIVRGGLIVYASAGVAALGGRPVEELLGHRFDEFVAPEERATLLDRYARRFRGEALPDAYEATLLLPDGARRRVEVHIELDGADFLVHLRGEAQREARRLRLEAVAALGAAIQGELALDRIHARVRDGLTTLGLMGSFARASEEGLRVLWSTAPAGVPERFRELAGLPFDGYLVPWTPFTRRVWTDGWAFSEEWGRDSAQFVPEPIRERCRELVRSTGDQKAILVRLDQREAAEYVLLVVGEWLSGDDAPAVRLFGAQIAAALDAARTVEELSLLNEVGRIIAGSLDLDRVLRDGAEAARRLVDGSRAFVVLYDPQRGELRVGAGAGIDEAELARFGRPSAERSVWARVIRERRAHVVRDVQADPDVDEAYRSAGGACSLVAAPVLLRGEPLGVLVVDETRHERRFGPSDVQRVTAVANQLAVAIENARLYAEARGRLQELATVTEVARVVSSSLDLEEVLGAGAEHLARTLDGTACTILLEDARGQELRRAASRGAAIGPARVPLDEPSLPRDALEAHAPVTGRAGTAAGEDAPVLAVPLHVRGHPVGVALVSGADASRVFTPGELARATAIASQLAVAVDNARLYSETRRRAEELGLLHEVGRSLVETLDIGRLLEGGIGNLARIIDAPGAFLALATPEGDALEISAVSGPYRAFLGRRLPIEPVEGSLASLVFHRREPILVEDALGNPMVNEEMRAQVGGRGYLGLPVAVRDRTIGAVLIVDPRGPRRFTPAEVERAAAIANQLAVAVENARLYEDLRRSYGELERAQRQLVERERLAALGELSAIVAHEVRNPLGVIFNSLGSLRRLLRPSGDAKLLLDIVGEEADRLNRIVGDLLDFARPSTPQLQPEALERVVEDAIGAALAQRPAGIDLARELDPAMPPVPIDARLVRQAVLNVAVNAVQAMPRGGRMTVRTRREGAAAVLEIEDTGAGIAAEVRGRIFEPFFTTKASGTGLGLAVVRRIVEGHGGSVEVSSRPGAGTVFALRFPLPPGSG